MNDINSVNRTILSEEKDLDEMISELEAREEFLCTGKVCGGHAEFI